jgi:hypothetical protein
MNRQERKHAGKGQSNERIEVTGIVVHFANGQYANLDKSKVMVVDKDTNRPLFEEVLDASPAKIESKKPTASNIADDFQGEANSNEPNYSVVFDTPEGRMIYVRKGNWSGVRPARADE